MKSKLEEDWQFILEYMQPSFWERALYIIVANFGKGLKVALLVG